MTALSAALAYGEQGLPVFPCNAAKEPLTRHGFKDASTDAKQITNWWTRWPDAFIGMPTGDRFCVLDLDRKNGKDGTEVVPNWIDLSPLIATTASGGLHVYFAPNDAIGCSTDKIGRGVDTRGKGGYVVTPPSPGYSFINGVDLSDMSVLPPWPEHLHISDKDNNGPHEANEELKASDQEMLAYAVSIIPNDSESYKDWKDFLLALHGATGGGSRFCELAHEFSKRWSCGDYSELETDKACVQIIDSPPDRIGAGSIFRRADEAKPGWRNEYEAAADPNKGILDEMNEKFCVLPVGGKTRVITFADDPDFPGHTGIAWASPLSEFKSLHNKYRVTVTITNKKGEKETEKIGRGAWWAAHEKRRQYDKGMKFMPTRDEPVVNDTLNLWTGFAVKPIKPEGRSGAAGCNLFLDHALNIICSGNEEHFEYLMHREAFIAQKRTRSEVGLVLLTEQEGTGKGTFVRARNRLYGAHAMQITRPEHVTGKHNVHLEKLLCLTCDEATFAGDPRHRNVLFGLITEPTIPIEPKFVDAYAAPNHLNLDILTNSLHAVQTSGRGRRYLIPKVSEERAKDLPYFEAIDKQLWNDGGHEALLYHLLHERDITDFNPRDVPMTEGAAEQAEYSRRGVDLLVETVCHECRVPYSLNGHPYFSESCGHGNGYEERVGFDYFIDNHPDRELKYLGALTVKRRLAKYWGCLIGERIGQKRGIKWPDLTELRQMFEAKHGKQHWANPNADSWEV
jgi:Bifunctional DNA primase/polymerase, N-terminal/Family of unknown function (DUF5906)